MLEITPSIPMHNFQHTFPGGQGDFQASYVDHYEECHRPSLDVSSYPLGIPYTASFLDISWMLRHSLPSTRCLGHGAAATCCKFGGNPSTTLLFRTHRFAGQHQWDQMGCMYHIWSTQWSKGTPACDIWISSKIIQYSYIATINK